MVEEEPATGVRGAAPVAPRLRRGGRSAPSRVEVHLPEPTSYKLKKLFLGQPLHSERLAHETLGKPTALAVFASDNLSSCAYATEEILRVLVPWMGFAAFSLVTPVTGALLIVLGFLILSYRQTIRAYPSAGGAYIVTRDNFGLLPAQVAGVALLTDYVLTVAVSVAAGSDALASAIPSLAPVKLWIALAFVGVIAWGNLRGTKESGKLFAVPTYFFIVNMFVLLGVGVYKAVFSTITRAPTDAPGIVPIGHHTSGTWLMGASIFIALKAFGSGGAAVTGVEAISNGVPAFRPPAWKNARDTLVVMGTLLGIMFLGLSSLAARVHAMPYEKGTPTVISQVGKYVYGESAFGHLFFYLLQAGTMLILVLAANTSFADFPRLASFHAGDNFMPRQFMIRGHRLVFSNGIIFLAVTAVVTLLATGGQVSRLIPLYAIGVFTSFTLSQAGMTKHHLTHREEGWRVGIVINGVGALLSLLVLAIVAYVKFPEGAWVIVVLVPLMVIGLVRLNKAYEAEDVELREDALVVAQAPTLKRHAVAVFVDDLDAAAARAMQYARTLAPDDLVAVHFDLDPWKTDMLTDAWQQLGFSRFPLDVVECPDRRIPRAALEYAAERTSNGQTELSILIPRREYTKFWHRFLHDRSSGSIAAALADLPHCNVTIVPYHLGDDAVPTPTMTTAELTDRLTSAVPAARSAGPVAVSLDVSMLPATRVAVASLEPRQRALVAGRVRSMRVHPWGGSPSLEIGLADETGSVTVVFLGRRSIGGVRIGTTMSVSGVLGTHSNREAILNPDYSVISVPEMPDNPGDHH